MLLFRRDEPEVTIVSGQYDDFHKAYIGFHSRPTIAGQKKLFELGFILQHSAVKALG